MNFKRIDETTIEIFPENVPVNHLLEQIARLSYELAETIPPWFVQPFDIPPEAINFSELVSKQGLKLEYLNGRLCSTIIEIKDGRLFFDAQTFKQDRGSPELFLTMVKEVIDHEMKNRT